MRILFIGDVVGKLGRYAVSQVLPELKTREGIDFVCANAENLTHGRGAKIKHLKRLKTDGVDFFTSGDHIFHLDKDEPFSDPEIDIIRPANYPPKTPGTGYRIVGTDAGNIAVLNLLGLTYLGEKIKQDDRNAWIEGEIENPFVTAEKLLKEFQNSDVILVDFHAEVTSEKRAMGFFLDGRVTAVLGTHTHVPTADPTVLPKESGYVSDIGMTGARDSVLGVEPQIIIDRLKDVSADPFEWVEKGAAVFRSVIVDSDSRGLVKDIRRLDLEVK